MSSSSKVKSLPPEATPLEKAGAAQDQFVATLGDTVVRNVAQILEDKDYHPMARIGAAKLLLEWMRPKKGGIMVGVSVNAQPRFVSHLGLPQQSVPPDPGSEVYEAEELPPVTKILPEPLPPMKAARLTAHAEVTDIVPAPAPPLLPARTKDPSEPAMPPKASSVKRY